MGYWMLDLGVRCRVSGGMKRNSGARMVDGGKAKFDMNWEFLLFGTLTKRKGSANTPEKAENILNYFLKQCT